MARIHLVLSDDWELRGDGSGDMRAIQFDTIKKLMRLYEDYGFRGSFNAEVLQQLMHQKYGAEYPELKELAGEWEETIKDVYRRGHDVQLHVHVQWNGAVYDGKKWTLGENWSITTYDAAETEKTIRESRDYLESVIRQVDGSYSCKAFRSGAWSLAPSDHLLGILADAGLVFDMSIVRGIAYNYDFVQLDYTNLEEDFLPYYPDMKDARRVAGTESPIVCIPTFSFETSKLYNTFIIVAVGILRRLPGRFHELFFMPPSQMAADDTGAGDYSVWVGNEETEGHPAEPKPRGIAARLADFASYITGTEEEIKIATLAGCSYADMLQMVRAMRKKAARSGWDTVPVVLENHTKDIRDFAPVEKFCRYISKAPDIEVITSAQLADNITSGLYPVRKK